MKPEPIRSETLVKTIGIVQVSFWRAAATTVVCATITSGCKAIKSLASGPYRFASPEAKR
jgi:hypothetical protein